MVNETILAVIIAFVISAILCPIAVSYTHLDVYKRQVKLNMQENG